jgi:hypothetical protein
MPADPSDSELYVTMEGLFASKWRSTRTILSLPFMDGVAFVSEMPQSMYIPVEVLGRRKDCSKSLRESPAMWHI